MKTKSIYQKRSNTAIEIGREKKRKCSQDNKNVFFIDDENHAEQRYKRIYHKLYKSMYSTKPKSILMIPSIVQPPPIYNSGLCLLQKNFQVKHSLTEQSQKQWQTYKQQKMNQKQDINLAGKFKSMGIITKKQLLDQEFQDQFQQISRMNRFKNTLGDANQLKFLKPYLRNKKNADVHAIKSILYKEIMHSANYEMKFTQQTSPPIYEYLTEYNGSNISYCQSPKKKKKNTNVLREKIKIFNNKSQKIKKIRERAQSIEKMKNEA